jgi:hypothetical protein
MPKATALSWRQGHRRPPKSVLEGIRLLLQARAAQCNELWREYGIEIARRDGEPVHRHGFMEIRERDGPGSVPRDARNRLGRPKRKLFWREGGQKLPAPSIEATATHLVEVGEIGADQRVKADSDVGKRR